MKINVFLLHAELHKIVQYVYTNLCFFGTVKKEAKHTIIEGQTDKVSYRTDVSLVSEKKKKEQEK